MPRLERGNVESLSFNFTHPPEDEKKKKKKNLERAKKTSVWLFGGLREDKAAAL